jgi:hypothetical protein
VPILASLEGGLPRFSYAEFESYLSKIPSILWDEQKVVCYDKINFLSGKKAKNPVGMTLW